ncbi:MAG: hypothetical protein IJ693_09410 [Bacteroidaceae bacterium]|nr:hypothetical protein [Bacteroidaceae bacterium]
MLTDFTKVIFRRLRLIKIDRNFLVFLIFLAISINFWFMQSIKETTEVTLAYKLKVEDLPKDVVYTSNMPTEVNVTYTSKGWNAFYYKFMKNEDLELSVPFKEINQKSGKIVIDTNVLRRAVLKKRLQGMSFKSTSPSKIEVYYSNGQHKRVPIVFNGHITTTAGRYLCGTLLHPDSVDIYAPKHIYGSINSVKTENFTFNELEDTLHTRLALLVPRGAKAIPDSIDAEICVDIFTDKTLQVPIYSENVPHNKIMRTFPLKATVTFLVSSTLYDNITPNDFLLSVDYKDAKSDAKRCKLYIRQQPGNIRHLRISPESVEYVIEQISE